MMTSNINSYYVLAFAVAASILRSNCIIHNCPRYRAATYSGTVSIAANDIAMMTSRTFQRLSCGHDSAGSDSLGFSTHLQTNGFVLPTQIIFGSNAIEHGINLIEEKTQNVLLVSGWNSARLDPILWEMEPRGFQLGTCCVTDEPTLEGVHSVVAAALESNCRAIIAMGCGSVIDTAKMAAMLINSNKDTQSLARMTADQLGSSLLSICGSSSSESPLEALLLITIPALPSMGAELSAVAALRLVVQTASPRGSNYLNAEDASDSLEGQLPTLQQELDRTRRVSKFYVQTRSPDLCLIQPSLTYRASMELVHDRVLGLIGTSIDIILSDPGDV